MIPRFLPRPAREWLQRLSPGAARQAAQFSATHYWEKRYAAGGTSGEGSYGRLAEFKAGVINDFVAAHGVQSVIEFGCGDGNQLSLLSVPKYVGLDVSASVVQRCISRFGQDTTKSFFLYDGKSFHDAGGVFQADLILSLDVIYHVVSDEAFESYMSHACSAARRHLMLYTTDYESPASGHQRHRAISHWMKRKPEFVLARTIPNPYAGSADGKEQSDAKFLIYERQGS